MLKRFFVSFAGGMAAIWLSMGLLVVLFIFFFASLSISALSNGAIARLEPGSVLYLDLSQDIDERPVSPSVMDQISSQGKAVTTAGLNDIVTAIDAASRDTKIKGIYIDAGQGSAGIATRFAIVDALKRFKKSKKWVVAYGDSYTQGDYLIASIADSLIVNPQGSVDIHGLTATTPFFKGFLDKVGVDMQIVKVGTYKSAVEPFMLTDMSEASREQQESYLNDIWATIVKQIGDARGVDSTEVNLWADSICASWPVGDLIDHKIVNKSYYRCQAEEIVAELAGKEEFSDVNLLTPSEYVEVADIPHSKGKKTIAVLYAVGDINDSGTEGIVGPDMVDEINDIIDDDDIDALVLRVNSGGGSAFASEQIWEALTRYKGTGRPLYVSMGDYAASGGYYISCCADRIYAQPQTLTGSIGIFGMIPCAQELATDKLGINFGTVSTNPSSANITLFKRMTPSEAAAMQRMIDNGYETFVGRVASGRDKTVDEIKAIAEGRVWDGRQALDNGLVDKLGTLDDAIRGIADELDTDNYRVIELPKSSMSLWEEMMAASSNVETRALQQKLGEAYTYYKMIDNLGHMGRVQCRMELIEIN